MTETANTERMQVRYEVKGREIFLDGEGKTMLSRKARRILLKEEEKLVRRFGHLVHPETGERPVLTMAIPNPLKLDMQVRLDGRTPELRAWLKEQGIVIEDTTPEGWDGDAKGETNPRDDADAIDADGTRAA